MNLEQEILKEHNVEHAKKIAAYASSSPAHFKDLMKCFLSNHYRLAQRAAWAVSHAAKKEPKLIQPYIITLVEQLKRKDVHNAVIRNSLRVLQDLQIPEELHGEVLNACFGFIEKPDTPIAFKAFSLTILANLSKQYPDIKQEIKTIIEDRVG